MLICAPLLELGHRLPHLEGRHLGVGRLGVSFLDKRKTGKAEELHSWEKVVGGAGIVLEER